LFFFIFFLFLVFFSISRVQEGHLIFTLGLALGLQFGLAFGFVLGTGHTWRGSGHGHKMVLGHS
jgi:hypothetical protein